MVFLASVEQEGHHLPVSPPHPVVVIPPPRTGFSGIDRHSEAHAA